MKLNRKAAPAALKGDKIAQAKYLELMGIDLWCAGHEKLGEDVVTEYCLLHSRLKKAQGMLAKQGELVKTPNGYEVQNPWLPIANRAQADMLKLAKLVTGLQASLGKKEVARIASGKASRNGRFTPSSPPKLTIAK